jgi:hypothetical protein
MAETVLHIQGRVRWLAPALTSPGSHNLLLEPGGGGAPVIANTAFLLAASPLLRDLLLSTGEASCRPRPQAPP